MSSSKRKRLRLKAEEEADLSTPWKKYGLDLDSLECPICTEPFSPPVFQCDNGHTVCSTCCPKLNDIGCHSCSLPIGRIRCLGVEKVIEALWVECEHGCATPLRFRDREEHERSLCEYRPIKCPMRSCTRRGPMCTISEHLMEEHNMPTAEWCEDTQSASFDMDSEDMAVLVKAKDAWLFVSLLASRKGHRFTCESVWASKEVISKLTVKAFPQTQMTEYSMATALLAGDVEKYLFVPGQDNSFDVTLSIIASQ